MVSTASAWFCLGVGLLCLGEGVAFAMLSRRRRPQAATARGADRQRQVPMLFSMGTMFTVANAARLRHWTGFGLTAAFAVGMACSVATVVFAVRSLAAHKAARQQVQATGADR